MPQLREPAAAMITEVYDALVAAGVPDREARKAAEAVTGPAASDGVPPDHAGAAVEIWATLVGLETARADRLERLRLLGSALVAVLVAAAIVVFGAFPDARLVVGAYPVHGSVAVLALALILVARLASSDRRESRLLAAARDDAARGARSAEILPALGPRTLGSRRGAGLGLALFYLAEAALIGALAYALIGA